MAEVTDLFRQKFKYFKARKPPPDLASVLDFEKISDDQTEINGVCVTKCILQEPTTGIPFGLKPVSQWQAYSLNKHPGFVLILNPFVHGCQRYWIKRCLQDYHLPPNVTNLDAHLDREETSKVFDTFASKNREELLKDDLLLKLRWVTLGYHYDWTEKKYYADKFSEFPPDLSVLSSCIAQAIGYKDFRAEAGIVNYYHLESTLAGHTDHSEFDLEAPLISISFGQEAIFLLGGQTKSTAPSAMYLRSGDICVMGGESRMAYHAVPRIISSSRSPHQEENDSKGEVTLPSICDSDSSIRILNHTIKQEMVNMNWKPISVFLKSSRINVNIRQVLKPGQTFPRQENNTRTDTANNNEVLEHIEPCIKKSKLENS